MARLVWGEAGTRFFETGISNVALYVGASAGVAWSGVTSINEEPVGGDPRAYYYNGLKYLNLSSAEEYEATIEALSAPLEFSVCDGTAEIHHGLFATQQPRKQFNLCYKTKIGNDVDGGDHAHKLHIVYNALAAPAARTYTTVSGSVDVEPISWKISTLAPVVSGIRPSAHFVVDSRSANPLVLEDLTNLLYGTELTQPELPEAAQLVALFAP